MDISLLLTMRKIAVVLALMACGSHGFLLQTRANHSFAESQLQSRLSDTAFAAQAQAELDELSRHILGKRALKSLEALADLMQAFSLHGRPAVGVRGVLAASLATDRVHVAEGDHSLHFFRGHVMPLQRSGNVCMDITVSRWIEIVGTAAFLYFAWMRRPKKSDPNVGGEQGDRANIAATAEEEYELHEFCCEKCGYTIFPARNRQEKFFTSATDFECTICGAGREAFFDMTDYSDPRTVKALQDDPDFDYEIVEVEVAETDTRGVGEVLERGVDLEEDEDLETAAAASADALDEDDEVIELDDDEVLEYDAEDSQPSAASTAPVTTGASEDEFPSFTEEFDFPEEQIAQFRAAFDKLDLNGDGTIEAKELGSMMTSLGYSQSEAELQKIINEFDANGNGSLEFPEFVSLMARKMKEDGTENGQQAPAPPASSKEEDPSRLPVLAGRGTSKKDPAPRESESFDPLDNDLLSGSSL